MLPFELQIGLRYTHAKRRNHFISFISIVSMAGIALGVMALIVVLSVMNGFQEELRSRILGVAAHLEISGQADRLADWRGVLAQAKQNKEVVSGAPYVNAQGMLANGDMVRGAIIRGVLPELESQVADFSQHMKAGKLVDLKPGEFGIILGAELARVLNVYPGNKLVLLTPQGNITPAGVMPRIKQFTVTGIFEAGMFEYDSGLALIHLQDAQKLLRLGEDVSGVRLKLDDLFRAPFVTRALSQSLNGQYYLTDWTQSHANFFRAVAIEKRMMFLILLLIVAVAAFNIVSTLVMAVTDKQSDIAILRTLGRQACVHHDHLHRAGCVHRRIWDAAGGGKRGAARAQSRNRGAHHRTHCQAWICSRPMSITSTSCLPNWYGATLASSPGSRCSSVWPRRCIRAGARRASIRRRRCVMSEMRAALYRVGQDLPTGKELTCRFWAALISRFARANRLPSSASPGRAKARCCICWAGSTHPRAARLNCWGATPSPFRKRRAANCATRRWVLSISFTTCCRSSPHWKTRPCR